ncbi:MAG: hypothetical protein DHS20C15_32920 [Planctomycetota bacterium]|nr:MAG: hypothetical protein DHS20C15_32920 [Planctomycetota bacterium]
MWSHSILSSLALVHDGHGEPALQHSAWHWLLEPAHLPVTLAAFALTLAGVWLLRRRRAARVRRQ